MSRPTIGLVISVGWGVRTFLQTDVLPTLKRAARVVVFTDPSMVNDLRARWGDQVTVEPLIPHAGVHQDDSVYGRLQRRHDLGFQRRSATTTRRAKQRMHRPSHWRQRLSLAVHRWRARWEATTERVAQLRVAAARAFVEDHPDTVTAYQALFRRYDLSLLVTTVAYMPIETPPLLSAQAMGLATGCWVASWDNLTSKGPMPLAFDHYFVWSDQIADELHRYYPESIDRPCTATGVPHFDGYALPSVHWSRSTLCRQLGFDPDRPIVLYAACTPFLAPNEHLIVERLARALATGALHDPPQLVVRLHPNDPGTRFQSLRDNDHVHLQLARTSGDTKRGMQAFLPTEAENALAINTVRHADVVVNIASTMTLEAAISDRPVVNIAFDLSPDRRYTRQIEAFYGYDHFRTAVDTDAVVVVHDMDALLAALRDALDDPSLRRAGRADLARHWCGPSDGAAGLRLGTALAEVVMEAATA